MLSLSMKRMILFIFLFVAPLYIKAQNKIVTPESKTLQMNYLQPYKISFKVSIESGEKQRDLGVLIDELKIIEKNEKKYYERVQQMPKIGLIDTSIDNFDNLSPIFHAGHNSSGYMHLNFGKSKVTGEKYFSRNDSLYIINNNMPGGYFDSNMFEVALRLLPLKENYEVSIPYYVFESGGYVLYKAKVTRGEKLKTQKGKIKNVWVLEVTDGKSTSSFYITKDTRTVIKGVSIRSPQVKILFERAD